MYISNQEAIYKIQSAYSVDLPTKPAERIINKKTHPGMNVARTDTADYV